MEVALCILAGEEEDAQVEVMLNSQLLFNWLVDVVSHEKKKKLSVAALFTSLALYVHLTCNSSFWGVFCRTGICSNYTRNVGVAGV